MVALDSHESHHLGSNFVVALLIAGLLVMFAITGYIVSVHRQKERDLANEWFARGEAAMFAGKAAVATDAYRNALSYDPDNQDFRLRLAQALLADAHYPEARSHLMSLWEADPANGETNFTLARLMAKTGDKREAVRYYRNAINGVWDSDPHEKRITSRFELARYLLQQHDTKQAAVELIALQADPPQDESGELELAKMLSEVGETARAESVYEATLKNHPDSASARLGSGTAAFELGDYKVAERQLAAAVRLDPSLSGAEDQLELVRDVLDISPNLYGLSEAERARRVSVIFDSALERMTSCAASKGFTLTQPDELSSKPSTTESTSSSVADQTLPDAPGNLQELYQQALRTRPNATVRAMRANADLLEPAAALAFEMTRGVQEVCPATDLADRALLTLAQHHGSGVQ